jgi:hypothetical protein
MLAIGVEQSPSRNRLHAKTSGRRQTFAGEERSGEAGGKLRQAEAVQAERRGTRLRQLAGEVVGRAARG